MQYSKVSMIQYMYLWSGVSLIYLMLLYLSLLYHTLVWHTPFYHTFIYRTLVLFHIIFLPSVTFPLEIKVDWLDFLDDVLEQVCEGDWQALAEARLEVSLGCWTERLGWTAVPQLLVLLRADMPDSPSIDLWPSWVNFSVNPWSFSERPWCMEEGKELNPPRWPVPSEPPPGLSFVALGVTGAMAALEVISAISCQKEPKLSYFFDHLGRTKRGNIPSKETLSTWLLQKVSTLCSS